ncbi:MAG TPA: serine/threonine-protein kinase [Burkholderiales bacterium]|jgi:serine/threonine protein kinase|nr:serine/threonine-protein kinase [Burkholderiales bacterium]
MADTATPASSGLELDLSLQVGKYDIQKMLGKGASGTVYLAKDTFTGKLVALKVIEPEVFRDTRFGAVHRSQFLNEASLAGKLRHPHIIAILDAVVGEDSGHIAMEFVEGGDLSQHVTPEKLLPPADVLQIGFKCCGAMDYAYREQGIVHRDIKPANIMIAHGTDIKIADFGAAFLKKSQAAQTAALGSPFYMAPEQIEGHEPTFHSDMYSLGVVLYELLVGRRPFIADDLEALIEKILRTDPVAPSEARRGLPREIDALVLRAMKKDPAHRYGTWAQFGVELSRVVGVVMPASAIPDSEKYLALSKVEMLQLLSDAEFWELAAAGSWSRAEKGKAVIKEDTPGNSFYFLAKGQAKVTKQGRLLNMINEGECFGEMAFIRGGEEPRHATVECLTDVVLAEFKPETLESMSLSAQLHLTRALVCNVVDRLALANIRIAR